jgi:hypothetical protein
MSVYKVAQDVEADDKLIGPFSFRQFIYLVIVAISIALGWGLSQISIALIIIPLPIIIFFGALALPLKKDQPMETYLAAILSFHLKSKRRMWIPDGDEAMVEVIAPKEVETSRIKDLSQIEAERRLSYLADIVDTQGWAVRGVAVPEANSSMTSDVYYAAQQTEDVLSDDGGVAANFEAMIHSSDQKRQQQVRDDFQAAAANPTPTLQPTLRVSQAPTTGLQPTFTPATTPALTPTPDPITTIPPAPVADDLPPLPNQPVNFNPYPTNMRQTVIQPLSELPQKPTSPQSTPEPTTTSEIHTSPDIINLANNNDLSIETIAHEANRIKQKKLDSDEEVVISLH